jgi:DNA-binding transcriptional ArsR family regulator
MMSGVTASASQVQVQSLSVQEAATYAGWFACLAEPMRVRLLHAVATAGRAVTVGELTEGLGISQSTCSHHVRKLAETGFVLLDKRGTATLVSVNPACCTGLPHAADAVMGAIAPRPCCPEDLPDDASVRELRSSDWADVRRIYAEGIATGDATFETSVPSRATLDAQWLPGHRWVAEIDGRGGRVGCRQSRLDPRLLPRSGRDVGLRGRGVPRPRRREIPAAQAGHCRR